MHFSDFSPVDFRLVDLGPALRLSEAISMGTVSGGDYSSSSEFADYSWHGIAEGYYEGFKKLPYDDPNMRVKAWVSDLLASNGLISGSSSLSLDVFVQRLKMKAQKGFGYDYRACLVELKLTVHDKQGSTVREATVEGLAKLHGSELTVTDRRLFSISVVYGPDEPPVCKLAIANALRGNQKSGVKTEAI